MRPAALVKCGGDAAQSLKRAGCLRLNPNRQRGGVGGAIGCAAAVLTAPVLVLGGARPATPTPGAAWQRVSSEPVSSAPGS